MYIYIYFKHTCAHRSTMPKTFRRYACIVSITQSVHTAVAISTDIFQFVVEIMLCNRLKSMKFSVKTGRAALENSKRSLSTFVFVGIHFFRLSRAMRWPCRSIRLQCYRFEHVLFSHFEQTTLPHTLVICFCFCCSFLNPSPMHRKMKKKETDRHSTRTRYITTSSNILSTAKTIHSNLLLLLLCFYINSFATSRINAIFMSCHIKLLRFYWRFGDVYAYILNKSISIQNMEYRLGIYHCCMPPNVIWMYAYPLHVLCSHRNFETKKRCDHGTQILWA